MKALLYECLLFALEWRIRKLKKDIKNLEYKLIKEGTKGLKIPLINGSISDYQIQSPADERKNINKSFSAG